MSCSIWFRVLGGGRVPKKKAFPKNSLKTVWSRSEVGSEGALKIYRPPEEREESLVLGSKKTKEHLDRGHHLSNKVDS